MGDLYLCIMEVRIGPWVNVNKAPGSRVDDVGEFTNSSWKLPTKLVSARRWVEQKWGLMFQRGKASGPYVTLFNMTGGRTQTMDQPSR